MAKKKSDFEKMGNLEKGVGEAEETTEDVIKEIENFDATKPEETKEGGEKEPAAEKKKAKAKEEDTSSLKEELEREREKSKSLAEIIEKVSSATDDDRDASPDIDSKIKVMESKVNDQIQPQMKDIRNAIAAMGSKVEELSKAEKPEKASSKLRDMMDQVQADTSKKIDDMQEEIRKMIERMEQPKKEEEVSKGLAIFGGRVDLKNEILEIKSSLKDQEKGIRELKEEMDTRITRVREQIKVLEKMPAIEEKLEGLIERMSPANIEKLKKFIFSADEITGEIIPNEIEKKMGKELTPVFNDIRGVRSDVEKLSENIKAIFNEINYFRGEIKTLYKLGDYISDLQTEKEKIYDRIKEKEANLMALTSRLEVLIKKRTDLLNDQILKFDKTFTGKIEAKTKEFFDDMTEEKFLELEDRTEKNLAVARAKVNDMVSKFVQFQNVVNPTLSLIKEELEKMGTRVEKVKVNQAEFQNELEDKAKDLFTDIAGPEIKSIRTDVAKFTKDVSGRLEDFEAEFVQFQNVVNPTLNLLKNDISKLDTRLEKLKERENEMKEALKEFADIEKALDGTREWAKANDLRQKDFEKRFLVLESRLNGALKEFDTIVKQTITDKRKFEEEAHKQRDKINILLKELKS
jgi:chromosome segregation ATPase